MQEQRFWGIKRWIKNEWCR